jgi:tetratricopeptide (TPR) repeat protein
MVEATLPLPAKVHAALARALDWIWPRGAAWAYADAIAHAPRDPELRFLNGRALGRAGRWPDAVHSLAAAARLRPSSVEYQGALVAALARARRERELLDALRRFAQLRPGHGEVHVLLGAILQRRGQKAEALRAYRLGVRLGALPATRRFVLGETVLGAEGWRDALAAWSAARQIDAASGPVFPNVGHRSALNFHPGFSMGRVARKEAPRPRRRSLVRLRARLAGRWAGVLELFRRGSLAWRRTARVRVLRKAWRQTHPGGGTKAAAIAVTLALASVGAAAAEPETAAAREQARLCERQNGEQGANACRKALALGIGPERRGPVRELLARHLVTLERWDELAGLFREDVRESPESAAAWQRLGLTLLFALDEPAEALAALEEAVRFAPTNAVARLGLGLAAYSAGHRQEARAALEEALRLDPNVLDARPAARAVLEAIRRGEPWP